MTEDKTPRSWWGLHPEEPKVGFSEQPPVPTRDSGSGTVTSTGKEPACSKEALETEFL